MMEHEFENGICKKCGGSEAAIKALNFSCEVGSEQPSELQLEQRESQASISPSGTFDASEKREGFWTILTEFVGSFGVRGRIAWTIIISLYGLLIIGFPLAIWLTAPQGTTFTEVLVPSDERTEKFTGGVLLHFAQLIGGAIALIVFGATLFIWLGTRPWGRVSMAVLTTHHWLHIYCIIFGFYIYPCPELFF